MEHKNYLLEEKKKRLTEKKRKEITQFQQEKQEELDQEGRQIECGGRTVALVTLTKVNGKLLF